MFLHFKYANTKHCKKSLYSIVVKKNVHKMSSVHGSSVITDTHLHRKHRVEGEGCQIIGVGLKSLQLQISHTCVSVIQSQTA